MLVRCPCGLKHELLGLMQDEYGVRWAELMMKEVPHQAHIPLYRYMMLFKPPQQGLRWSTLFNRTKELVPMIKDRRIERRNQVLVIPLELWVDTLNELVEHPPKSLRLPLKGHGYLLEMLASRAEKAAAKAEQKREEDRRNRSDAAVTKRFNAMNEAIDEGGKQ